MDTLQLIEINQKQLLATLNSDRLNFSKSIKIDIAFDDVKNLVRKINRDILNDYIKSGPKKDRLDFLKKQSYDLFNILTLFNFDDYFIKLKKGKKPYPIQLILDFNTNSIPFEILNDGKDFLSDYIIFSRILVDSKEHSNQEHLIDLDNNFTIVANPSEDEDIEESISEELSFITDLIDSNFTLKGPYRNRNVNKIDLIRVMGEASLFHFSGHYTRSKNVVGWKLYNDIFNFEDIKKISKIPNFIFSNSCGDGSLSFFEFINSFLNKGTKVIISTLGQVPSAKASEFSQNFYRYFIKDGHNAGKALFLSREEMIKKYDQSDLFWCFYQLYGSTSISINKKLNIRIKKSKKVTMFRNLFFSALLVFLGYLVYNNFFIQDIKTKKVHIKSNINLNQAHVFPSKPLKLKESDYESIVIYCNSIDDGGIDFCTMEGSNLICDRDEIFINSYTDIAKLLDYKSDTLHVFQYKKDHYIQFHIEFDNTDNLELYIDNNQRVQTGLIINIFNHTHDSYELKLSDLLALKELYGINAITKSNLEGFKSLYIEDRLRTGYRSKVKKSLFLNIKKALIK